jgi:DHA2 family multidrug resistance protein
MSGAALSGSARLEVTATSSTRPSKRPLVGLFGVFLAAMMAGMNNRVGVLALADVRGALGFGLDEASWLSTVYAAGELIAMPFASWFAITFSVRRFHLWMVGICAVLAVCLPFVQDLHLALGLRFLQGICSGTLIPILMMMALKVLPPSIRLHGLALYAMTATFMPNLSIWLAGQWTDAVFDWRWIYWQIVPLTIIAGLLVGWGLPREPIQAARFRQANWTGVAFGATALSLIAVAVDQGVRLDWFNSALITVALLGGLMLLFAYLLTEWYHPSPFLKLQILGRRNLGLGFTLLILLLVVFPAGALLPSQYLAQIQNYRALQTAPIGLIIALPQLVLGPLVALLLYQRWADARIVFALGLALVALACALGSQLTADWNWEQFVTVQALQALGQPMALVALLFLATGVVQPAEGPYVSGAVNTLRALGALLGGSFMSQLLTSRGRFHTEMLLDHAALAGSSSPQTPDATQLMGLIAQQSLVLSVADAYLVVGLLALLMIPAVLCMTYIPAPETSAAPAPLPPSPSSNG